MDRVVDEKGLVNIGFPIVLYFPFNNTIVPLKVKRRLNYGYETFEYGHFPYTPVSPAVAGVIPTLNYSTETVFSYSRLDTTTQPDMFYHADKDTVFHAYMYVTPEILRIFTRIPKGTTPQEFRGVIPSNDLATSIEFGFSRGMAELAYAPKIRYGIVLANETNIDLQTYIKFVYAQYETDFIDDAQTILNIIKDRVPAHMTPLGGTVEQANFGDMLDLLGAKAIPYIPSYTPDSQALQQIQEALR